jgi:hypothetical protein
MSILYENKDDDLVVLCHQAYLEETLQLAARKSMKNNSSVPVPFFIAFHMRS